jgi:two-component system, NtrC family, response regulator HydG
MSEILLVDDNPTIQNYLKICLTKLWHNVAVADSFKEASGLINNQLFDTLITDTSLCYNDEDWIEVAKIFKEKFPNTKIIAMSGTSRKNWEWNCDVFVLKDEINNQLLLTLVWKVE